MERRVASQIDQVLLQRYNNILRVYEEEGMEKAVRTVQITLSNNPMQLGMGYQIVDPNGESVIGNIKGFDREQGYYHVAGEALGFSSSSPRFRMLTKPLGDDILTLGFNENLLDDLKKSSVSSFSITFIVSAILALVGAMFLAFRSHARVRKMAKIMDDVGRGNLSARLPVSNRGDDIDQLSGDINNAMSLLQKQVNGLKQVSFNIAHDLKTPLNRLFIKIEEAVNLAPEHDPILDKLESASEEAAQINQTFECLLRIAQIEAGARKSEYVLTDLNPLMQKAYEAYDLVAEDKEQNIDIRLDTQPLNIMGDADLLQQLIVNLVENAISHSPPKASITLRSGITDHKPWIMVCDNGPGIPDEYAEQVFERLYRLEKSRTSKGSGLGLSYVKAISETHGGIVTLSDNKPGLCATVSFGGGIAK